MTGAAEAGVAPLFDALASAPGRVCVVGSANADLTVRVAELPKPGQTIAGGPLLVLPGGKSANQAATVGRLGVESTFIGAVGDDPHGAMLRDSLVSAGVDATHLVESGEATGTAMILVDEEAENCIVISAGANGTVDADLVRGHADAIRGAGALGLCLEVGDDAVVEAARIAADAGVPVVFNLSPVREAPAELLGLVDVLIVNEHELAVLVGDAAAAEGADSGDWSDAAEALARRHGIRTAVVTLGGAGSVVVENGDDGTTATHVDPVTVDVVDTTGCGDSYMGSVMAGLASGLGVRDAARLAAAVSAYAAGGQGAQASYGTAEQVREFAATGRRG
ncbi:ribokinase [uncultured Corynebacterium sp.]|uniref:ribokinase n=1 Tax=uncultured Corynebacterium sp. TaxID=159447 RepID=UPI0025EDC1B6|nr:ribokinase [uncultured Corynebacterium sp.]